MTKTGQLIKDKIDEYGITLLNHDDKEDVFFLDKMIIFIKEDNNIKVAFQATTKPEDAANDILIFQEIPDIDIEIMESFIYCDDNKLISGKEAYKLINDTIKADGIKAYMAEETYTDILTNMECHEC